MKITIFQLLFFGLPSILFSQKIDHSSSIKNMNSDSYFRYHYENDYFAATDENYTQGYNFELVSPGLKKNPVNHLFWNPKTNDIKYGLALEHIGYTPNHYELFEIQYGDRPFAAAIMLKSFMIATNNVKNTRFTNSISLGLIGPGAFGEEMQVGIHEATGNKTPLGWHNQIRNDVVLNYGVSFEKELIRYRKLCSLNAITNLNIGTLFTNASIGVNTTFGINNSPFSKTSGNHNFQIYFYTQPVIKVIGYDATMQGGIINRKSIYTIVDEDIERFTAQLDYGLVLTTKTLYFEFSRSLITREYNTGNSAAWGGVKVGFTF